MSAVGLTTKTPTINVTTVTQSDNSTSTSGNGTTVNSGGGKGYSGKLETAIAGLKRKQLYDNNGGDTPLVRKVS